MPIRKFRTDHGDSIHTTDVPLDMAKEMTMVGIVPFVPDDDDPPVVGSCFEMAGQTFRFVGEVTRDEFLAKIAELGLYVSGFSEVPADARFFRISTD